MEFDIGTSSLFDSPQRYEDPEEAIFLRVFCVVVVSSSLQRSADAAVLAHAPEVDGDEQGRRQRHGHAVEHVEAQERVARDEPAAQEQEASVAAGVDQLDVADLQQL